VGGDGRYALQPIVEGTSHESTGMAGRVKAVADRLRPGSPSPLGATPGEGGVNFALYSAHAEKVELCLFDEAGREERARLALPEHTDQVWHGFLEGAGPGTVYGYRVHGPFAPEQGHRFNPHRLLLDPYARAWVGGFTWSERLIGRRTRDADLTPDPRDTAPDMPKCRVTAPPPLADAAARPLTAWAESVIYEAHAKGLTRRHPDIAADRRGTYAALGDPALIDHLHGLGVTALELLPLQAFFDEPFLKAKGLTNYWGYNPLGFFVVEPRYAFSDDALAELRASIARLHAAGIEVILDVVLNHTGEGDHLGPTLAFRGLDNRGYYRLDPDRPRYYRNSTGCGHELDLTRPRVLQLALDSLRYWVEVVGVDGFRFDLATTLGRGEDGFDTHAGFMDALMQDPVLGPKKRIAEPWDIGHEGYRLGGFAPGWGEWNDRFRDGVRAFWRGDERMLPELAARLLGSADIFERRGRKPWASVNHITAHDGFTLADLVSYARKHNEANREGNRDGHDHNLSWNSGVEGPTSDPTIQARRRRSRRSLAATLMLAQGTPMLLAGDELGRSQNGNNNAYCQDNATSWLDWSRRDLVEERQFRDFVAGLIALRRRHPVFRRRHFLHGRLENGLGQKDVHWLHPQGREMAEADWQDPAQRAVGLLLAGDATLELAPDGTPAVDDVFLLLVNAGRETVTFALASDLKGGWESVIDTAKEDGRGDRAVEDAADVEAGALILLKRPQRDG